MPEKRTIERARRKAREGKRPSTQAGEFVREEIRHVRAGKHGARSTKQAIAIGLAKARRAGVKLGPPPDGRKVSRAKPRPSSRRARAVTQALRREPRRAASHRALSRQAHRSAAQRGPRRLHDAAMRAVRTKGKTGLQRAARKAARTRKRR
jgi:hypothetical protein